ncbi:MAG TPA: hypothetical protein VGL69_10040 [Solirubrobacteraceae bacterium]|jgi:diamine N-acetyltransferase
MKVALRPVTRENVRALCDLRLRPDQHELVAPAAVTIAEAHYEPAALLRAIYADDDPVGILFVETEGLVPYLVRFMITEERTTRWDRPTGGRAAGPRASGSRIHRARGQFRAGRPDGQNF